MAHGPCATKRLFSCATTSLFPGSARIAILVFRGRGGTIAWYDLVGRTSGRRRIFRLQKISCPGGTVDRYDRLGRTGGRLRE